MATNNDDGVEMTSVDLGGGAPSEPQAAPFQESNPYKTQEDDMTNVDLGPQPAPRSFNTHVQGAVAQADKGVSAATDNKVANQMESMTAGAFTKMVGYPRVIPIPVLDSIFAANARFRPALGFPDALRALISSVCPSQGLKPAEGFFCIAPGVCGLRMLVLIIAIIQVGGIG